MEETIKSMLCGTTSGGSSSLISASSEWKAVAACAAKLKTTHLRDALENADRNANLLAEAEGIVLDYAREKVDGDAMAALFALARKANV